MNTERGDFLANLPTDTVNQVLLSISEDQMARFVADVVPQYIRDATSYDATTTLLVNFSIRCLISSNSPASRFSPSRAASST